MEIHQSLSCTKETQDVCWFSMLKTTKINLKSFFVGAPDGSFRQARSQREAQLQSLRSEIKRLRSEPQAGDSSGRDRR